MVVEIHTIIIIIVWWVSQWPCILNMQFLRHYYYFFSNFDESIVISHFWSNDPITDHIFKHVFTIWTLSVTCQIISSVKHLFIFFNWSFGYPTLRSYVSHFCLSFYCIVSPFTFWFLGVLYIFYIGVLVG